ncbi:13007_t:CDS:2, partial [Gigaspora margarita]
QIKLEDVRLKLKDQNRITSIKVSQSDLKPAKQKALDDGDICIKADQLETDIIPL